MGVRGELFSSRVSVDGRTYFFNVKENRNGDVFLAIVESKPTETETFDRRSIVVFKDNLREFLKSFEKALEAMDKAPDAKPRRGSARPDGEKRERKEDQESSRDDRPRHAERGGPRKPPRDDGDRPARTPGKPIERAVHGDGTFSLLPEAPADGEARKRPARKDDPAQDGGRRTIRVVKGKRAPAKPGESRPTPKAAAKPAGKRLTVKRAKPK